MNRQERERRKNNNQTEIPGDTRKPKESRRAKRRRLRQQLGAYLPEGGNSGMNIQDNQVFVTDPWGSGGFEG